MSLSQHIAASAAILFSTFAISCLATTPAVGDALTVKDCTYGDVYEFSPAGCTATLENTSVAPLVLSIVAVQPGTTVTPEQLTLGPHEHAEVATRVRTDDVAGDLTWSFRIESAGKDSHILRARGFVMSVLDEAHPKIDFGPIDPAKNPVTKSIAITSSIDPNIRVTKILSSTSFLHARIGDDAKTLFSALGSDAPWGPFDETVKLGIDAPMQKQAWVKVAGDIEGDIAPEKNPYWLGTVAWQPERVLTVPLMDRDGHDFKIGSVTSKDFAASYDSTECEPARPGCRNLRIHVADAQPAGFFKSQLDVALPDRARHLNVTLWGVLEGRPPPWQASAAQVVTKLPLPAPQADAGTPPPLKVQADPPGEGPLLKWTIAHQDTVHGYQVFRSASPDGPFDLMNAQIIPRLDNGGGAVAYRWRDVSAVKGQAYWYYIAVIYNTGDRHALSGPQKAIAK